MVGIVAGRSPCSRREIENTLTPERSASCSWVRKARSRAARRPGRRVRARGTPPPRRGRGGAAADATLAIAPLPARPESSRPARPCCGFAVYMRYTCFMVGVGLPGRRVARLSVAAAALGLLPAAGPAVAHAQDAPPAAPPAGPSFPGAQELADALLRGLGDVIRTALDAW